MIRGLFSAVVALTAMAALPDRLAGQIDFSTVLDDISDVGVGVVCWWNITSASLTGTDCGATNVFVELTYELGNQAISLQKQRPSYRLRSDTVQLEIRGGRDTIWVTEPPTSTDTVRVDVLGNRDTTWVVEPRVDTVLSPSRVWRLVPELGLGYSQVGNFSSAIESISITGAVRELPYFVARVRSARPDRYGLELSAGIRTGIVQLHNFRATRNRPMKVPDPAGSSPDSIEVPSDLDDVWGASAQTFALGWELGARIVAGQLEASAMITRQKRFFSGVEWAGQKEKSIPNSFPGSLNFSGWGAYFGIRFHVGNATGS